MALLARGRKHLLSQRHRHSIRLWQSGGAATLQCYRFPYFTDSISCCRRLFRQDTNVGMWEDCFIGQLNMEVSKLYFQLGD